VKRFRKQNENYFILLEVFAVMDEE